MSCHTRGMDERYYERPREKLQRNGASYLVLPELIQLIIGSGTARASGAKLARLVEACITDGEATVERLLQIQGIGIAKACQIVSALELGARVARSTAVKVRSRNAHISQLVSKQRMREKARHHRYATLYVWYFDGSLQELSEHSFPINTRERVQETVQKVASNSLSLAARTIIVAIVSKAGVVDKVSGSGGVMSVLHPSTIDLAIIKLLKDAMKILSISVEALYFANSERVAEWRE